MEKNNFLLDKAVLSILLGTGCNLNCAYCYQHHKYTNQTINIEYVRRFFEDIYVNDMSPIAYNVKAHYVDFIGGEPFVYIDLVSEITEMFLNYLEGSPFTGKPVIHFNTNGVLLDTPKVQQYLEKYGKIVDLTFSIDGCKESHNQFRKDFSGKDTYDRVWNNFVNADVHWKSYRWTIDPTTVKYFYETIKSWLLSDYASSWDYQFNFQSMDWNKYGNAILHEQYQKLYDWYISQSLEFQSEHPLLTSRNRLESIVETVIRNAVICPQTRVCLDFDGSLTKCNCVSKVTSANGYTEYGNILETDPVKREEMWKKAFSYLRGSDIDYKKLDEECYRCPIGSSCCGCPLSNKSYSGDEYVFPKNACLTMVLFHSYMVLFKNTFLYANKKLNKPIVSKTIYFDKDYKIAMPANYLVPKCWALEILTEDEYNTIANITTEVGGRVNPIQTKGYTDADFEIFKQEFEKVKGVGYHPDMDTDMLHYD